MKYNPITEQIILKLKEICGDASVMETEGKETYSHDENPHRNSHIPEVVITPSSTDEVSKILKLASQNKIPVTPRGSGTGLSGGAVPVLGGIVLSLEKMNQIIEVDVDNFCVTSEAGATLENLCRAVEGKGLYYPVYPGEITATVGGNVATNAGGMRAVRYGVTRNFVLGLEAVTADGNILCTGGKYVKSSTAYDLTQLITGSEGTLAVITRIILKLMTAPGSRELLMVPFENLSDAIKCVPALLKGSVLPVSIEFMENDILDMVKQYTDRDFPISGHPAYLLIMIESENYDEFCAVLERISQVCFDNKAIDVFVPPSENAKRNLLDIREQFYPTMQKHGMIDMADAVVPRSRIADFVEKIKEISSKSEIPIVAYGHAGDGNVHLHFLQDSNRGESDLQAVLNEIYAYGVSLGGTISGEHGLGSDKKQYLNIVYPKETIDLMKRIKASFDPEGILNPGKLFD